jgi:hypothetical protein
VNNKAFPEGTVFSVDHLGEIPNGGSLEVSEDAEAMFISARGMSIEDAFKNNDAIEVSGSSSVDAAEIIGDREQPGPLQGVRSEEQEQTTEGEEKATGEETPQGEQAPGYSYNQPTEGEVT